MTFRRGMRCAAVIFALALPAIALPRTIQTSTQENSNRATALEAKTECSETEPRKAIARLTWKVAGIPGSEQRVAVTVYRDGFETGKFETTGSLLPGQSSLIWNKVDPGVIHYYRVLTLHGQMWTPSDTATFDGPTCVADLQPRP